jgi:SAM-dependent methyltransferase
MTLAERYVAGIPSDQNAVNLFTGEWSSQFPSGRPDLVAGTSKLYEDQRIDWAAGELGGLTGKRILELGPLEAGHSYMAEKLGADSILAIEANSRSYLKCLIAKEIFGMSRVRFMLGDFVEYLSQTPPNPRFDVCFASGVLYHMRDPLGLLEKIARFADAVFLWTHYNDPSVLDPKPKTAHFFGKKTSVTRFGRSFELREFIYQEAVNWGGFCGGNADSSYWMKRDDILDALRLVGYKRLTIALEHPDHPNGPAFCVVAMR